MIMLLFIVGGFFTFLVALGLAALGLKVLWVILRWCFRA